MPRIGRADREAHSERVRDQRALDAGCAPAYGDIVRIVCEFHEAASQALAVRLAVLQGWVLEAPRAQGA